MKYFPNIRHLMPSLEERAFLKKLEDPVYALYDCCHYAFIIALIVLIIALCSYLFNYVNGVVVFYVSVVATTFGMLKMFFLYMLRKILNRRALVIIINILNNNIDEKLVILQKAIEENRLNVTTEDLWWYFTKSETDEKRCEKLQNIIEPFINNNDALKKFEKKDLMYEIQQAIRTDDDEVKSHMQC